MSGGAFNYIDMADFIDVMKDTIIYNNGEDVFSESHNSFSPEIISILLQTIQELELMDKKLHAIDYLLEGDYGEESFLAEWKEIVK